MIYYLPRSHLLADTFGPKLDIVAVISITLWSVGCHDVQRIRYA